MKWLLFSKIKKTHILILAGIFVIAASSIIYTVFDSSVSEDVKAATITWDGGGADNNWSTAENWSTDVAPTNGDSVTFNSTSTKDSVIDTGFINYIQAISIESGYTGTITKEKVGFTFKGGFSQADGTFTYSSGTLFVGDGTTDTGDFVLTGGEFDATSSGSKTTIDTNADTSITGGIIRFPGDGAGGGSNKGEMLVNGNFTIGSGATVYMNDGAVSFDYDNTGPFTIDVPSPFTFYQLNVWGDFEIADGDTVIVSGPFECATCTLTTGTGSEIYLRGNISHAYGSASNSATTLTLDGTADQDVASGRIEDFNIVINKPSGTVSLQSSNDYTADITLTDGTLSIDIDTTFTSSFTQTGGAVIADYCFTNDTGSTTNLNGGTFTITVDGCIDSYDTITVDGTSITNNGIFYMDDFALDSGTLDLSTGEVYFYASTVANNGGTVIAGASSLTEPDASLSALNLTGDWNFYDFTSTDAGLAITFEAGSTYTVNGTLTLTGASGNEITLASSSPGTAWNLNATTASVDYVNVTDSDARYGTFINPTNSTDGGNNLNWFTAASFPSGSSYVFFPPKTYEVTVLSPNGGEVLESGDIYPITWYTAGSGPTSAIDIYYTLDQGENLELIAQTEDNDGSYDWLVPSISVDNLQIVIKGTDLVDPVSEDMSDHVLSIINTEEDEVIIDELVDKDTTEDICEDCTEDDQVIIDEDIIIDDTPVAVMHSPVAALDIVTTDVHVGDFIRSANMASVWRIFPGNILLSVINPSIYFTWAESFADIKVVPVSLLYDYLVYGNLSPRPGTVLVKTIYSDNVYYIEENPDDPEHPVRRWITTEELANHLFTQDWSDYVIDIPQDVMNRYINGTDITDATQLNVDISQMIRRIDL